MPVGFHRTIAGLCAALALFTVAGCKRGGAPEGQPPRLASEPRYEEPREEKRSAFGIRKIFAPSEPIPGYGWDGQYSSVFVNVSPDAAFNRSLDVMRSMRFTVLDSPRTGAGGQINAQRKDLTTVEIIVAESASGKAEMKVKVGSTGDRTGSEKILDEIQKRFGAPRKAAG